MNTATFKAYLYKEYLDCKRNYRYLLLAFGLILFAILDPVMFKLMPFFIDKADEVTKVMGVRQYIKDLSFIGFLFVTFSIAGTLTDELKNLRLVIPFSKGASPAQMVLAKTLHYIVAVAILLALGYAVNYYYAAVLLKGDNVDLGLLMQSLLTMIVYFIFNINLVILLSSIFKSGVSAGMISFLINIFIAILSNIKSLNPYLPSYLFTSASRFTFGSILPSAIICLGLAVLFTFVTIQRMTRVEVM